MSNSINRIESDDQTRLVKFIKSDNNTKVNVLEFHKHPLFLKLNQSELQNKVYYYDNANNYYFCKFKNLEEKVKLSKVNAEPNNYKYNNKTINKIVFDVYWIKNGVNDEWREPIGQEKELKFDIKLEDEEYICDGICDLYDVSDFGINENVNPSEMSEFDFFEFDLEKRKKIAENMDNFNKSFPQNRKGGKKTKKFNKPKYKYSKKRYNKSHKNKSYKKK
jgi:hypothetical protein